MKADNRIVRDFTARKEKQARLEKALGVGMESSPSFLSQKLLFMRTLPYRYQGLSQEERLAGSVVSQEVKRLERMRYPNLLVRLIQRLINSLQHTNRAEQFRHSAAGNLGELHRQIEKIGFGNQQSALRQHIREGADTFSIPLDRYFENNRRMHYSLNFEKNSKGDYELVSLDAALHSKTINGSPVNYRIDAHQDIQVSPKRLYNLLQGRAILSDPNDSRSALVSLDLTDTDTAGRVRLKTYYESQTSSLEEMTAALPMELKQDKAYLARLTTALADGDLFYWTNSKEDKSVPYRMETNALKGAIEFYDPQSKKVSTDELLHKETAETKTQSAGVNLQKQVRSKKPRNSIGC